MNSNALDSHKPVSGIAQYDSSEIDSSSVQTGILDTVDYSRVNQATQRISQADSEEQILEITAGAIGESPFISLHFVADGSRLILHSFNDPAASASPVQPGSGAMEVSFSIDTIDKKLGEISPLAIPVNGPDQLPPELDQLFMSQNLKAVAMLPIRQREKLFQLFILGSRVQDGLNPFAIQPYTILASFVSTALEKLQALGHLQRRVSALQSIASISQAISEATDLNELYELIHEKITQVMGEVDLVIAIYNPDTDTISISYAHEAGEKININPFPLGQGLTSILIRTQQPLILVEDTERRAVELGAIITGAAAKSWLGAPLIVSGEVIGAIIVQDVEYEHRFDNDDLRLLTTLASQVAVTIRNIRLLQEAEQRAEQERVIAEITSKLWASADIDTIARIAIEELGRVMHASRATIKLHTTPGGL